VTDFSPAGRHGGGFFSGHALAICAVRLFERTSREVRLSPAGRGLLPYAEELLAASGALAAEAARLAATDGRVVRLAYPSLIGPLAAQVARRLARRRPAVQVELRSTDRRTALADLARGEVAALGRRSGAYRRTAGRAGSGRDRESVPDHGWRRTR
jgi:DNA-binding transcriptional LysR family regulator